MKQLLIIGEELAGIVLPVLKRHVKDYIIEIQNFLPDTHSDLLAQTAGIIMDGRSLNTLPVTFDRIALKIPVIALIDAGDMDSFALFSRAGAWEVITMPFSEDSLALSLYRIEAGVHE